MSPVKHKQIIGWEEAYLKTCRHLPGTWAMAILGLILSTYLHTPHDAKNLSLARRCKM